MKAINVETPGGAEKLKPAEYPDPIPKEKEILVKVSAAALNRADILQREGNYPPPKGASEILGLEISGEVVECGKTVVRWKKGDKIFGLIPGGGYSEFAVIHEEMANPVPKNLSMIEASAIAESFLTAYQALVWLSKLNSHEKVLIHAGASGVGTSGIQIAREIGAEVFVTASASKHDVCIQLGASKAIDYRTEKFHKKIMDFTNGLGVDVIIDFIGAPYFKDNIASLKADGRMIILAAMGGGKVDEIDLRKILRNRLSIIGSTLRARSLEYQIKLNKELLEFSFKKFEEGKLKPVIDKVFNFEEAAEAHKYMEANKNIGKIVLNINTAK
jgi:tumor protein p53-inducible protein 3